MIILFILGYLLVGFTCTFTVFVIKVKDVIKNSDSYFGGMTKEKAISITAEQIRAYIIIFGIFWPLGITMLAFFSSVGLGSAEGVCQNC